MCQIEFVTPEYGLRQITNESKQGSENFSSCIDLIFTSQANLAVDSGVQI